MRSQALALLACLCLLSSCDTGRILKVTDCAIQDERLSFAFKNPGKAVAYLDRLVERLDASEPGAAEDAADLIRRFRGCIAK